MRKRRNHDGGFKARVAFEAVKGERPVSELAAEYGVHPTQSRGQIAPAMGSKVVVGLDQVDDPGEHRRLGRHEGQIGAGGIQRLPRVLLKGSCKDTSGQRWSRVPILERDSTGNQKLAEATSSRDGVKGLTGTGNHGHARSRSQRSPIGAMGRRIDAQKPPAGANPDRVQKARGDRAPHGLLRALVKRRDIRHRQQRLSLGFVRGLSGHRHPPGPRRPTAPPRPRRQCAAPEDRSAAAARPQGRPAVPRRRRGMHVATCPQMHAAPQQPQSVMIDHTKTIKIGAGSGWNTGPAVTRHTKRKSRSCRPHLLIRFERL